MTLSTQHSSAVTVNEVWIPDPSKLEERPYVDLTDLIELVKNEGDLFLCAAHAGAFSDIYIGKLRGKEGDQKVAVKLLRGHGIVGPEHIEMIRRRANRETWVWHELRHPNVLEFLGVMRGFGQLRDCPAFVSPYCENGIVTEYLKSHPQADRLEMIRSVASGLSYLHGKKVIHGDFKPTNILIGPSGNPVICDFGRSEILSHRGFTTGFASSRRYQAPELFLETEKPRPTQASDVYSFAISAFEIWTGIQPYREIPNEDAIAIHVGLQNGRPVCPEDAPPGKEYLWPLLEACWERDKSKRMDMETLMRKM